MEDEWEGINLASLHDNPGSRPDPARTTNFRPLNFQEFLPRPLNTTNPQQTTSIHGSCGGYLSSESPPPPPPLPGTALSLNSCSGHHPFSFPLGSNPFYQAPTGFPNGPPDSSLNVDPFDGLASSCSRLPEFGHHKRSSETEISSSGDRRNKRMIKNRESAARSRARKQAYTNELELEVQHLLEENARLKRQQQQLPSSAASQVSKKQGLHRSSTAPF